MFSIEHDYDCTIITLVDEDAEPNEDVVIRAYDDHVEVEQWDEVEEAHLTVFFTIEQLNDLAAAFELPEGVYQLVRKPDEGDAKP